MNNTLILVDENDQPIGTMEKMRAHEQGLRHRAFSVLIFDDKGQLLLQQRQFDKYHCGGLWTNTCCSHPMPGETIIEAATRRVYQELGLRLQRPLEEIGMFHYIAEFSNGLIENEMDYVVIGFYQNEPMSLNPIEVADIRWQMPDDLLQQMAEQPENYTPWFKQALAIALSSDRIRG